MSTLTPTKHDIDRMRQLDFLIRGLRIAAIAMGVLGAIWLLGGDRDPDAAEPAHEYIAAVTIRQHDTFDFNGIQFFEIAIGNTGARMTVSVDADLAVAEWLRTHTNIRAQLVLRDVTPMTRDAK